MELFKYLVKEISRIGENIHLAVLESSDTNRINLQLISDSRKGTIVLRLEMNVFSDDPDFLIFENDIINIQTNDEFITLDCKLYSDYGIDNIMAFEGNLDRMDPLIFNKLESELIEKIFEHLNFFQS